MEYFAKKDEERKRQAQEKERRKEERMAKKEEKSKLSEKRKQEQLKKKMERESKKLRLQLAWITAKVTKAKKMLEPWERDTDERKCLSFVPDSDSEGDVEIDINKCFKCDEEFDPNDKEVYRCDHCPRWFHRRCLPKAVLAIAEAEG